MVRRIFFMTLLLAGAGLARAQDAGGDQSRAEFSAEYQRAYTAAVQAFNQNDFNAALLNLNAADQIRPGAAMALNLRGAVYVRLKKYDEAQVVFADLYQRDPGNMMALFNLGETYFLKKDYAGALKHFQLFAEKSPAQKSLGVYKVFLCDLQTGREEDAARILAQTQATPDDPLYYYLNAADLFKRNRTADARGYLQSAFQIYSGQANAAFVDSLIELGYVRPGDLKNSSGSGAPAAPDRAAPPPAAAPELSGLDELLPSLDAAGQGKKK